MIRISSGNRSKHVDSLTSSLSLCCLLSLLLLAMTAEKVHFFSNWKELISRDFFAVILLTRTSCTTNGLLLFPDTKAPRIPTVVRGVLTFWLFIIIIIIVIKEQNEIWIKNKHENTLYTKIACNLNIYFHNVLRKV